MITLTKCSPTSKVEDSLGDENSTTCGPTASTKIHITASVGLVMSIPCSGMQSTLQVIACCPDEIGALRDAVNNPSIATVGDLIPFKRTSMSQSNSGFSIL